MKRYVYNVLRGFDVFVNTLLGGKVRTISARIGDKKASGTMNWLDRFIDCFLERIDPGHSIDSFLAWQPFTDRDGKVYALREVALPGSTKGAPVTTLRRRPRPN